MQHCGPPTAPMAIVGLAAWDFSQRPSFTSQDSLDSASTANSRRVLLTDEQRHSGSLHHQVYSDGGLHGSTWLGANPFDSRPSSRSTHADAIYGTAPKDNASASQKPQSSATGMRHWRLEVPELSSNKSSSNRRRNSNNSSGSKRSSGGSKSSSVGKRVPSGHALAEAELSGPRAAVAADDAAGAFLPLADINTLPEACLDGMGTVARSHAVIAAGKPVMPSSAVTAPTAVAAAAGRLFGVDAAAAPAGGVTTRAQPVLVTVGDLPDAVPASNSDTRKKKAPTVKGARSAAAAAALGLQQQQLQHDRQQHVALPVLEEEAVPMHADAAQAAVAGAAPPPAMLMAAKAFGAPAPTAAPSPPLGMAAAVAGRATGNMEGCERTAAESGGNSFQHLLSVVLHLGAVLVIGIWQAVANVTVAKGLPGLPTTKPPVQGDGSLVPESAALWFLIAASCLGLAATVVMGGALLFLGHGKSMSSFNAVRNARLQQLCIWMPVLVMVVCDFFKLAVLQSVTNKLHYQGQWCEGEAPSEAAYAFRLVDAGTAAGCKVSPLAPNISLCIILAAVSVAVNNLCFLVRDVKGTWAKAFALPPALLILCLLWFKPVTALMTYHSTQAYYTVAGDFTTNTQSIVALVSTVLAVLSAIMLSYLCTDLQLISHVTSRLTSWCGRPSLTHTLPVQSTNTPAAGSSNVKDADIWPQLHAAQQPQEAQMVCLQTLQVMARQQYYLGHLPAIVGVLAPALTFGTLHLWNIWIALDLVAGAVVLSLHIGAVAWWCKQSRHKTHKDLQPARPLAV